MNWPRLVQLARVEVAATIAELPDDLRPRAAVLPVSYERVPNPAIIQDGIEPDTLVLIATNSGIETAEVEKLVC